MEEIPWYVKLLALFGAGLLVFLVVWIISLICGGIGRRNRRRDNAYEKIDTIYTCIARVERNTEKLLSNQKGKD